MPGTMHMMGQAPQMMARGPQMMGQGCQMMAQPKMMMGQSPLIMGQNPPMMMGQPCAGATSSVSADPGPQLPAWSDSGQKGGRRHKHGPSQIRREAGQREMLIREHFEAMLQSQKENYEAQILLLRAQMVAMQAICIAAPHQQQQPEQQDQNETELDRRAKRAKGPQE